MKDFTTAAAPFFKANPAVKRYYFTDDMQAFAVADHAEYHANKLKDRTVTEVFNPDMTEADITLLKTSEENERQAYLEQCGKTFYREVTQDKYRY